MQAIMNRDLRVLILEDSPADAELAERELLKSGIAFTSLRVETRDAFIGALEEFHPDIVLSDYKLPAFDGVAALEIVQRDHPEIPVIMVTGALTDIQAVKLIHTGAKDYVLKGHLARLGPAVQHALSMEKGFRARKQAEAQLLESEEKYRLLFESSRDALMTLAPPSWKFTSANAATLQLFGATSTAEFMALGPWDISPERQPDGRSSAEKAEEMISTAMREGSHFFEWKHQCIGGQTFDADVLLTRIDVGGQATVQATVRDITERKLIENERRRLSVALAQSDEAVALTDAEARYIYANPAFCKLFGYELNELVGNSTNLLTPPEEISGPTSLQTIAAAREMGAFQGEAKRRAKDGTIIPILLKVSPFRDEQDGLIGYIATLTDLTEMKRMEDALRESEKHYRDIIEHAPLGTITATLDGRFIEVNQAFCNIVGYPKEALKNLSFSAITHPDDINISLESIQKLIAGQIDSYRIEKRYFHKEGHIVWAQVDTSLQRGLSGEPQCLIAQMEDITAQKQAEDDLRESEEKLRGFYELSPLGIALTDMNGLYVEFNEAFRAICGYPADELKTLDYWTLTPQEYEHQEAEQLDSLYRTGRYGPYVKEYRQKDGKRIPIQLNGTLITGRDGKKYIWSIIEDITERKRAEANLHITASVFDNSQEAIVITSAENIIMDVNPAFTSITSYSREEVLGRNPKLLSSGRQDKDFYAAMWQSLKQNKTWRGEIWNRRKSGAIYAELLSIAAICDNDGTVQRYVGVFSDISRLKEHEAELNHFANYDPLTGMPNRRLLADRLSQAIVRAQRSGKMLFICFIDLDGFKQVNDQYGHEVGDQLLVDITQRLQVALRAGDTLARLGGDEFVMLFNDFARDQECIQVLDRVLDIVAMPVIISGYEIKVSASIGVTFFPLDNEDAETLMRHADQAMYVAKQAGRNRYHLYDPAHDQQVRVLHETRRRVLQGLEKGEFELFYQPKIELTSGKVVGVEALIRWHHPERGLLLPQEFLPFLEDSDMEIRLGQWVMDNALAQMDAWSKEELALEVSINISARHLQSPGFVFELKRRLMQYPQLPHGSLQIEVLETAALENISLSSETIEECRKLGVNFALDDFGTGYSSLAYLRKLSAETLKIDQSFVRGMLTNEGDRAIVQGIVALAKSFGHKTVAEGMEVPELTPALIAIGCMYGQGFDLARPMPGKDFLKWYSDRHA